MKKFFSPLWLVFIFVFIFKAFLVFFIDGPHIFSDEACVLLRSMHFADNLKMEACSVLSGYEAGDPMPLYSVLMSPIHLLFNPYVSYKLILLLNSLLFSSLVFPLFGVLTRFIKSDRWKYVLTIASVFFSSIFVFEKMIMTEALFSVICVWFLCFYIKFLCDKGERGRLRLHVLLVLFALLAALTRPYGFIVLLSFGFNELILHGVKSKVRIVLLIAGVLAVLFSLYFHPDVANKLFVNLGITISSPGGWKHIVHSFIYQFNSIAIATLFFPLIFFVEFFNKEKSDIWKKVRWFVVGFVVLNFFVSAQHLLGYLIKDKPLFYLTRYVHFSTFLISFFGIILLLRNYKGNLSKIGYLFALVTLLLLYFFQGGGKLAQNIDISFFYFNTLNNEFWNNKHIFDASLKTLIVMCFGLGIIFITYLKRQIFVSLVLAGFILVSVFNYLWLVIAPHETPIADYMLNIPKAKILYIVEGAGGKQMPDAWKILSLTSHELDYKLVYGKGFSQSFGNADYVLSEYPIQGDLVSQFKRYSLYKTK